MKQEMKTYIGTKTIRAYKINRKEYNTLRGQEVPKDENPTDEGYLTEYKNNSKHNVEGFEGYISWSPKELFEEEYKLAETWEDRVKIELEELEKKPENLDTFINKLNNPNKEDRSYLLLLEQRKFMSRYVQILKERLQLGAIELNNKEYESSK